MKWNSKFFKILILIFFFFNMFPFCVSAQGNESQTDTYKQQIEFSGADKIKDELPKDTKNSLDRLGINEEDWEAVTKLTPDKIMSEIAVISKNSSRLPFNAALAALAVMLLCALVDSFKLSFAEKPLGGIAGVIGTICICVSIITPMVKCISHCANVIKCASGFMLCYIPVMAGIMSAAGQVISGASYYMLMMGAGELISQISTNLLVPLLNIFLGISVVSSISPKMNLRGICDVFNNIVKWTLSFIMSVFVGLITIQSIVGTAADSTGTKTIKFAINSFVPIVGGALSDALNTVQGCVKLLKSGVGAFALIASGIIFIPVIIECLIWLVSINVCASIGDMFELKQISGLLRASGKVITTMLAIILSCMTILLVSTAIMLIIGGTSG